MTLGQLAKRANVSLSTASKALRGNKELSDETIALVMRVAEECGYFSGRKNRALEEQKRQKPGIAVIIPEIQSSHYAAFAARLVEELESQGALPHVFVCDFGSEREKSILTRCLHSPDINGAISMKGGERAADAGFPFLRLYPADGGTEIDYAAAVELAVNYLADLGHEAIGYLGETLTASKRAAFERAIAARGLPARKEWIVTSPRRFERAGYESAQSLIQSGAPLPTAFVAAYSEIGLGAISALMRQGIAVPERVSVVGINDIPAAPYFPVPLTTADCDVAAFCRDAAAALLAAVKGGKDAPPRLSARMKLFERSSAAPPAK